MTYTEIASSLKDRVVQLARSLGFDEVRVASAEPFAEDGLAAQERVRQGFMDGMPWFTQERVQRASDPQALLPGACSIIAVALSYLPPEEAIPSPLTGEGQDGGGDASSPSNDGLRRESFAPTGQIARYAQWSDYHQVMKEKLRILLAELPQLAGRPVRSACLWTTAPCWSGRWPGVPAWAGLARTPTS